MGKRLLDFTVASLGLLILLPALAATAAAVRLTSPGPAVFAQVRLGRYGRPFRMYKFRSMVADASQRGARVTAGGDPRVTALGRVLRRTKLDELPQLYNVLKGDMSLVGPRPEVPEFADMFPEQYRRILKVRPGITHRATLAFRGEEGILSDAQVSDSRGFYIDRVMPRKLAMYEECLTDPLLRDVWTILETVSPWKTTRAMTAGDLMLDSPIIHNVPAFPMPVAHGSRPRHAPAPVVSYAAVAAAANDGGDIMFSGTGDEIEDVIRIVQSAR